MSVPLSVPSEPTAISTNFLINLDSKVSPRKLRDKEVWKTNTLIAQTSHFLPSFQPHIAIMFVWILGHCDNIGHDVDRATTLSLKEHIHHIILSALEMERYLSSEKLGEFKLNTSGWIHTISELYV